MVLNDNKDNNVIHLGQVEIDAASFGREADKSALPVLPTRNLVLFPGVTIPIALTREASLALAREASEKKFPVGVVCQIAPEEENPDIPGGLYKYGVIADVFKVFDLPDGSSTAIIHGRTPFRIAGPADPGAPVPSVKIRNISDPKPEKDILSPESAMTLDAIEKGAHDLMEMTAGIGKDFSENVARMKTPLEKVNFIATNLPLEAPEKIAMLASRRYELRADKLLDAIYAALDKARLAHEIMERAKGKMSDNQRSAFLQMQLETIKEELYGDASLSPDDIDDLRMRAEKVNFPDSVRETFDKEIIRLGRYNPTTPDYAVQYQYLETMLDLPWGVETESNTDIATARYVLENDHYGLDKVKQRILEQLAVLINRPEAKAPILCLVGPPGVGKTSLGKSVARAMGRNYQRVSLGGLHDEAEIRGHRRTYIGAMPGRVIKAVRAAKSANPVLLLDEIDKIGKDYKGDPAAALLEVLDPEQNKAFHDNYIDVDFDLSRVLFIATANSLATVERPLLDRMEVIELTGYALEEKIEIARRHLIPRIFEENGVTADTFAISDAGLTGLIERYTAESGVRQLEKQLSSLVRKSILARLGGESFPATVGDEHLADLLGLPPFNKDKYENADCPGVVTGLAWTQVGGEILMAEASLAAGKPESLTVTGNLGDVMKESATIALQWVKAHAAELGIAPEAFADRHLHVHFPEGAIPKDGPSAGITIATAIASIFTGRKVRPRIAMTGEITLRGRVLPVGGIKEKILAAKRAGIDTIILSEDNRRDIEDIPGNYLEGMNFRYVKNVSEVMALALEPAAESL